MERSTISDQPAVLTSELGELGVLVNGAWRPVRGRRQAAVLAMLVLRGGRGIRSEELVDAVWADRDQVSTAVQSLRNMIGRLRDLLGDDSIVSTARGYQLAGWVGSERETFLELVESARAAADDQRWSAALDTVAAAFRLWRGDPWPTVDLVDEIDVDRVALCAARRRLEHLHAAALAATCAPDRAMAIYEQLLLDESTNERLWASLATVTALHGSRVDAVRVVQRARAAVAEAGLVVGLDLERIERQLLETVSEPDTDRSDATPNRRSLPRFRTTFVGRDQEIDEVRRRFESQQLVTVVGPGGAGKTRLAVEFATSASVPSHYVSLLGIDDATALDAMVVAPIDTGLLIIDNCEHLVGAVARRVDDLLRRRSDVLILATSRQQLGVLGECVYQLPRYQQGKELFVDRCRVAGVQLESSFSHRDANLIATLVDDLPLAIELAASQIRHRSTSEIIDGLQSGLLAESPLMHEARHRSLDAALASSLRSLSASHRRACVQLASCEDDFTVEIARELLTEFDCRSVLDDLVGVSLLDLRRTEHGCSYRMLTPIRHVVQRAG